ncbi:MAG: hypothetical protein Kow00108_18190 [Calditrichia bacterium]
MGSERVLVDLDGVIRDFIGGVSIIYKKYYPEHTIKPVISRDLHLFFEIGFDIYDFIFEHYDQITNKIVPYPGAIESLNVHSEKYDIVIATSQESWGVNVTYQWIEKYKLPVRDIIISDTKEELEGIALLDDWELNIEKFNATGRMGVCYEQPWNSKWNNGHKVKTIDNFFELIEKQIKQRS